MKKIIIIVTIVSLCSTLSLRSQLYVFGTDEANKAMGIEPRSDEALGCKYTPVSRVYDSLTYFESYEACVYFMEIVSAQPNISLLFDDNRITIEGLHDSDPKRFIRVLGLIDSTLNDRLDNGDLVSYKRFQCNDNSGAKMAVVIGYNHSSNVTHVTMVYRDSVYDYKVTQKDVPIKPYNELDDLMKIDVIWEHN